MDEVARRAGLSFETAPAGARALVARLRGPADGGLLVKPLTMMNLSGEAAGAVLRYYRLAIEDVLVVTDDVALPVGRLRARARGSAGGHNGLKSMALHVGTDAYARLRVGVGRGDARRDLADHVLAMFDPAERPVVDEAIARAADAVELFVAEGIGPVMNRFNAATDAEERSDARTITEES